jgi:hypothetical protein
MAGQSLALVLEAATQPDMEQSAASASRLGVSQTAMRPILPAEEDVWWSGGITVGQRYRDGS